MHEEELFALHDQSLRTTDPSIRRRNMARGGPRARVVRTNDSAVLEYDPSLENPYLLREEWFKDMVRDFMTKYDLSEEAAKATLLVILS